MLPRAVGARRARQLSLTGEFLDANRACEWGLVNELTTPSGLFPRVIELATMIEAAAAWSQELQMGLFAAGDGRPVSQALAAERAAAEAWKRALSLGVDPRIAGNASC